VIRDKILKLINRVENQKTRWFSILLTLFSIILLRNFLEGILEEAHTITLLEDIYRSLLTNFVHFLFFYLSLFLSFIVVLTLLTKEKIEKVTRVVVTFSPILLVPPIVDFFISKGAGLNLSYTTEKMDFFRILLTGPFHIKRIVGITPGMRIEVVSIYLLVFLYVFCKGKGILRSLLATIGIHLCLILFVDLPHLITILAGKDFKLFYGPGSLLVQDTQKFGILYLFLFTALLLLTGLLFFRPFMKKVLKSIRYVRAINYTGAVLFGFLIGYCLLKKYVPFLFTNPWDYLAILSLVVSVFFSFSGAVIFNDSTDIETDRISRKRNPLTSDSIDRKRYQTVGIVFFSLGLLFALNTSYTSFFLVLILILLSFIYSSPPFRLKRIPILATLILAFSTLLCLILGYSLFAGGNAFLSFPKKLQLLFLVSLTCGFTPKDLVDVDGDKRNGIFTIPVLCGKRIGKIIIYILVCVGFLFVPIILRSSFLLILSLIFTLITGIEFLMKRINEKLFLFTYYLFSLLVILFLFFNPQIIQQQNLEKLGYRLKGDNHFNREEFTRGLNLYSNITEPTNHVLLNAGISSFKGHKPKKAVFFLTEYLRKDPYHADAYSYLSNSYLMLGENSLATVINKTALLRCIDLKRFLSEKGILLFHSKDLTQAEEFLRTAYQLGYRESSLLYYLARIKIETSVFKDAEALLERLLKRDKNNVKALAELGKLKIEKKEYREAISIYTLALEIREEPLFYNNIGVCYQRLGIIDSARAFYRRAILLNPEYTPAKKNIENLSTID
jgi:4-hydroxybenzoate polyprenyltransferase/Flp pilus assembly protein TadD